MTKSKSTVAQDFAAPIAVLVIICVVLSAVLAWVNGITAPIIAETAEAEAEAARVAALPTADGFEKLKFTAAEENHTESITEVYKATNGTGYVFMIVHPGYGGKKSLNMVCSIDSEGKVVSTSVLSHEETPGLGAKVAGEDFSGRFTGVDEAGLADVDTIGGATISSSNYKDAIAQAFNAYNSVKGAQ